jgi:hypothetical protein
MSLDSLIRSAVAIADSVTKSLQDQTVTITPWIGIGTTYAEPLYGAAVSVPAIVEEKERLVSLSNGEVIRQKAVVTIPRVLTVNGATGRQEPVDSRDKVVLPSGYTGPILDIGGVIDPTTHRSYMTQIILG